ncbi:MAG: DNA recombination protein RmuC [Synergistaceae bacterium]|nr:DNA recombination protein RmuC [Synergistaceae bacterium]
MVTLMEIFIAVLLGIIILLLALLLRRKDSEAQRNLNNVILEQIERLQETLGTRIDVDSFNNFREGIGTRFNNVDKVITDIKDETLKDKNSQLYEKLGELRGMSEKISDEIAQLNGIFNNDRVRGRWGEVELESIIADVLPRNTQYAVQVAVEQGADERVDVAVKIPNKEKLNEIIYLPIDSYFPLVDYQNLIRASITGIQEEINQRERELGNSIIAKSRSIQERYIRPPKTTDFAIMFLPSEALYAEVLRILGLAERCQREYHVTIAGPTTITAILNAFRMVFLNFDIYRQTNEIMNVFREIQHNYAAIDQYIDKTIGRVRKTLNNIEQIRNYNNNIYNRLSNIVGTKRH